MTLYNCVEPCSGYGIAAHGIHGAGFRTVFAFDNNCWDPKSRQYRLLAVENYNANFKNADGSAVCHLLDIKDVTGEMILDEVRKKSGGKAIHFMMGGPPCVQWTRLNTCPTDKGTEKCSLMLEYLRLVRESRALVGVSEQVPDWITAKNPEKKKIRDQFFREMGKIGYRCAFTILNARDYGVAQDRERAFVMFVRDDLGIDPVFPKPVFPRVPITKYIDIDGFRSGHFGEPMKSVELFPQVCTVTSSSPYMFFKGPDSWRPTISELLWCQSVDPSTYNHVGSISKLRKGIGNGIPALLAYHISKCVRENILDVAYKRNPELF